MAPKPNHQDPYSQKLLRTSECFSQDIQDNEDIVSNRSARSGSNSAKAEPTKSKPSAEMANYKQMIYLFVARDSEMFVFEHHIEK